MGWSATSKCIAKRVAARTLPCFMHPDHIIGPDGLKRGVGPDKIDWFRRHDKQLHVFLEAFFADSAMKSMKSAREAIVKHCERLQGKHGDPKRVVQPQAGRGGVGDLANVHANETPEEKQAMHARAKDDLANKTPDEREAIKAKANAKANAKAREAHANETPEQMEAARSKRQAESANRTPEEREEKLAKSRDLERGHRELRREEHPDAKDDPVNQRDNKRRREHRRDNPVDERREEMDAHATWHRQACAKTSPERKDALLAKFRVHHHDVVLQRMIERRAAACDTHVRTINAAIAAGGESAC